MVRERLDPGSMETAELIRRGIAAARVGEADEARLLLNEAADREPGHAEVWLWLGSVAESPRARRRAFQKALELEPEDEAAKAGLDRLVEKYGPGILNDEDTEEMLRCHWHPSRETLLRCSRCDKPICVDCVRQHPVGIRCKACAKELRNPLFKISVGGFSKGFLAGVLLSVILSFALGILSFYLGWIVLFLSAAAGYPVADIVSRAAGNKRGKQLGYVAAGSILVGVAIFGFLVSGPLHPFSIGIPFGTFGPVLFALLGSGAAIRRLR